MGRILFLSAMAFVAYRYIAKSNKTHEAIGSGEGAADLLTPKAILLPPATTSVTAELRSPAAEPDPLR